ncbi:MAG: extracellular solute-binding protein [Clostridiales bacterium]|jgi:ABC-type glycerol-3-phosphate transport system substrate-binding protein|nr:extracellular solute-binding protein [Clostridiales bacterium]
MNQKKIVPVLLSVALAFSILSGCGSSGTSSTGKSPAGGSSSEGSGYGKHLTIKATAIDAEAIGTNAKGDPDTLYEWFKDKYNVSFEYQSLTWANYVEQVRIWINAGTAPDMMMLDIQGPNYAEYLDWAKGGAFKPIPSLEPYPTLSALHDQFTDGKQMEVDGQLYAWPAVLDTSPYDFTQVTGYIYRTDWAKAAGMYNEDDIYDWDEWWELVEKVIEMNPGNGGETHGVGVNQAYMFPYNMIQGISPNAFGFAKTDGGWVFAPSLPETREALAFVKDAYDKGLIYKDIPIEITKDKFMAGKVFAELTKNVVLQAFASNQQLFEDGNPGLDYFEVFSIAHVRFPNGKLSAEQASDHWSQTAFNASTDDDKIARVMDMLEYLSTDEGYITRNVGIPEVDWKYAADGSIEYLWTEKDALGNLVNPHESGTLNWVRFAGANDLFALNSPQFEQRVRDLITASFELNISDETVVIPRETELAYYQGSEYRDFSANLDCRGKFIELLVQPDCMAQWDAWVAERAAEAQSVIEILNRDLP